MTETKPLGVKEKFLVALKKRATVKFVTRVLILIAAGKIVRGSHD